MTLQGEAERAQKALATAKETLQRSQGALRDERTQRMSRDATLEETLRALVREVGAVGALADGVRQILEAEAEERLVTGHEACPQQLC